MSTILVFSYSCSPIYMDAICFAWNYIICKTEPRFVYTLPFAPISSSREEDCSKCVIGLVKAAKKFTSKVKQLRQDRQPS